MPVTRLRMRPWLEKQIASKAIPGLSWLDEEEMIFQIPWKHAARHGWNIDKDACLFRSWAIHTGKFKHGEKEPDPKTWKANFRCAMNSLPDIKEVKDKSIYKGSSAVRVYRMLPAQVKLEKKERKSKSSRDSKNKTKNKADDSYTEEVEEAVKHCQQPDDHSSYTARLFSTQEIDVGSTEIIAMSECEVSSSISELNNTMDIPMPDSTSDMYPFQVSPMASGSEEDEEVMNDEELFKILDPIAEWQQINVDGKGYYTNELAAPGSFLSDLSSVLEDMSSVSGDIEVRVTTDMRPAMESIWQELSPISCTL